MHSLKNNTTRFFFFLFGDLFLLFTAMFLAFSILNVAIQTSEMTFSYPDFWIYASISVSTLGFWGLYNINWRFVSLHELVRIFKALTLAAFIYACTSILVHGFTNYYTMLGLVTYINSLLLISGFRISKRVLLEVIKRPKKSNGVIIFGAGNAGEQIIRDVQRNNQWELNIEAIFDDKVDLWGTSIHDIPIIGGRRKLFEYLTARKVKEIIFAAPSIPKKELKSIIEKIKNIDPKQAIKVLPSFHKLGDQPVSVKNIRDIRIEDVLGREPAEIDFSEIKSSITGKKILVTGAGGSIGGEIVRQLLKFQPEKLIALDIDETELFYLENEIEDLDENNVVVPYVADVTDRHKMELLFVENAPEIIFHAAAYKHVPMMERYPEEAVRVNIGGTKLAAELACRFEAEKFILISTDKAVNPTNVMGATKRVAEQICMAYNDECNTSFISVRFGNVLGSRGSVVPLFIDQIKTGGPVTITDPEITRYFMTIPEAVLLVIQSGTMGEGGEVFVLDMGEPVKILDMAKQLIKLHGLEPDVDIQITFNGLRPGEKLFEELLNAEEGVTTTAHSMIYKASCNRALSRHQLEYVVLELFKSVKYQRPEDIRDTLKKLVPTYRSNGMSVAEEVAS